MPQLFFISPDGEKDAVEGKVGDSVMDAGVRNVVPGMYGLCGGSLACVTCHVYVDAKADRCTPMGEFEAEMLTATMSECRTTSRLSCQIIVTTELENAEFETPPVQY